MRMWVPGTVPAGSGRGRRPRGLAGLHRGHRPAEAPSDRHPPPVPVDGGRRRRGRGACGRSTATRCRCAPSTTRTRCGRCSRPGPGSATGSSRACRSWPARPGPPHRRAAPRRHRRRPAPGSQCRDRRDRRINDPAGGALLAATGLARAAVEPILWFLEMFLPGPVGRAAPTRAGQTRAGQSRSSRDPVAEAHRRTMVDKAVRVPHCEIAVRYAVAAPSPPGPPREPRLRRPTRELPGARRGNAWPWSGTG